MKKFPFLISLLGLSALGANASATPRDTTIVVAPGTIIDVPVMRQQFNRNYEYVIISGENGKTYLKIWTREGRFTGGNGVSNGPEKGQWVVGTGDMPKPPQAPPVAVAPPATITIDLDAQQNSQVELTGSRGRDTVIFVTPGRVDIEGIRRGVGPEYDRTILMVQGAPKASVIISRNGNITAGDVSQVIMNGEATWYIGMSALRQLPAADPIPPTPTADSVKVVVFTGPGGTTAVTTTTTYSTQENTSYSSHTGYSQTNFYGKVKPGNMFSMRPDSGPLAKRWRRSGGHFAGLGIAYGGLVQSLGHLSLPDDAQWMQQSAGSIGVDLNLFDFTIVSNRHFGLITGLGFEINNFRFDGNLTLGQDASGYVVPAYAPPGVTYDKTKLNTVYLNVPLLAEFKLGHKGAWINGGLLGGIRLGAHTKTKEGDRASIEKNRRGLNLSNFHWGMQVGVGYKHIGVYAKYYPQSIFKSGQGPKVQQVNIGVLLGF